MPYHHGNLQAALVDAGLELARKGGPDAVVLRAVSREAGVSHNAAYRHFADRDDLLAAVCRRCFDALADRMRAEMSAVEPTGDARTDARARLAAVGRAYVGFALAEPGWFRTAFGVPGGVDGDERREPDPYGLLNTVLDELVEAGGLPAGRRPDAEVAAWSAVHGLATLLVDGPLRGLPDDAREAALAKVLEVVDAGL